MSGHNGHNQFNQGSWNPHPSATNDMPAASHPLMAQQYGAPPPLYSPRSTDTMTSTPHGQIHPSQLSLSHPKVPLSSHPTGTASHNQTRGHQLPAVSPTLNVPHPNSGLEHHSPGSEHQQWGFPGDGGSGIHHPVSPGQPPIYNDMGLPQGRRPTNDARPKKCRIPDCTYNAYYDVSEEEQTEYCGQGHELQAISTGLVASCVMCKGRPRRTGERVCGRTCGERERQSRQVQGSYYGVPVVRRESRARGA